MTAFLGVVLHVVFAMLSIALVLCFVRLVRGPSLPDRVVALDLIALVSVGLIVADTINNNEPSFLRPAIVLGLISFLGTVAFARFIEKRAGR